MAWTLVSYAEPEKTDQRKIMNVNYHNCDWKHAKMRLCSASLRKCPVVLINNCDWKFLHRPNTQNSEDTKTLK